MPRPARIAAALMTAVVAAGLLTGVAVVAGSQPAGSVNVWAAGSGDRNGTTDVWGKFTPAPVAATESEAAVLVDGDTNGDGKLSEFEKQVLARQNYTLIDGTVVKTPKPGESVDPAIVENIKTLAAESIQLQKNMNTMDDGMLQVMDIMEAEQPKIGRRIIMVHKAFDGDCYCQRWLAWTWPGGTTFEPSSSEEKAMAYANDLAATAPNKYVVINFG